MVSEPTYPNPPLQTTTASSNPSRPEATEAVERLEDQIFGPIRTALTRSVGDPRQRIHAAIALMEQLGPLLAAERTARETAEQEAERLIAAKDAEIRRLKQEIKEKVGEYCKFCGYAHTGSCRER